jgi:hypothetical protein
MQENQYSPMQLEALPPGRSGLRSTGIGALNAAISGIGIGPD